MREANDAAELAPIDYDPFADAPLARVVPTTEPQREVWLASMLGAEASLAYNESVSLRLRGPLDVAAFRGALQDLVDRHEALRATISDDGQSLLLADALTLDIVSADLSALMPHAQERALAEARTRAVELPFDLERGPLVRCELLALAPMDHMLVISAHHIVCDGWSFGVLVTELPKLYAVRTGQGSKPLVEADSFANYAVEQLAEGHAATREADTAYWTGVFDKSVPVLDLPTDRARKPVRGFASLREDLALDKPLVDGVRKLGAAHGASLFVTLFGMFSGLLARLSGSDEVVVGVPSAGQAAVGAASLVGHCINLLPIRVPTNLEGDVAALLQGANTSVLDAYDHQHCTFGSLLQRLQVARDPGRLPLVSVLFNLDSTIAADDLSVGALRVELASNPRRFENFDLFVNATQVDGAIVLECQYNTDLFDASTVHRWLALFRAALERAVADPKARVGTLFRATGDDEEQLAAFNATVAAYPQDARVEHLIAAQARRTPQAVAVVSGGTELTYQALDARANAVALTLAQRGVGPGQLVGMACGRNEHLLVGMLGILKTGAGYVPLDPAFPAERLAYMRADAGLRWIVSDRSVSDTLVAGDSTVLRVDDLPPAEHGPVQQEDTSAPAYVIYTSGSTGKPKGVVVPQRAVVNFLASMAQAPGLAASDRLVAVTTSSFDIAVLELLLPLMLGARVILADRDTVLDGAALMALIDRHQATVMQATPSGWRLLLEAGWQGRPEFKALVGGEGLPDDLAQQLLARTRELWNMYGPTETTVWSTCWRVQSGRRAISIGSPIANTDVHVLDANLQSCPIGVAGELFIGGDGVASGYLNRPDLSEERFIADPRRLGHRMYRTGDRGRWCNDGLLEHLGRLDFQVKVRGYRIELGEIEAALQTHPSVDQVVVVAREDTPGDVRLVAYVVSRGPAASAEALRDHLRHSLPEYMVPQHVATIERLPLTPNGKIDRKALPRPELELAVVGKSRLAPRTPLEQQVLGAMEQVLNLPGLSLRDDFFALGGHSLLAAKLTARLNKELGSNLPLRSIFETPTAEGLARAVETVRRSGVGERQSIEHRPERREAPLTVMQERIRFMEELRPGSVVYNTPSAHRLTGPLDRDAFERALRQMVERQPGLRTAIVQGAAGPVQRVIDDLDIRLPFEDLSELPESEREASLMQRLQAVIDQPISVHQAPLFRAGLYRMAPQEHVFLFMPHHIVWDGWSFDLLYQEMASLYPAAVAGRPASLPMPPVTYLDYAHWHARWMAGDDCRSQLKFWKARYARVESVRALPTDKPRRAGMTGAGAVEWVHVGKVLTERLRDVARRHGATLNMLVMAVYAALLSQALGTRTLVLGVPVRGRLMSDVESVMGFFNNLLPTPLDVDGAMSMKDWIGAVKRELLDSFAHQDIPFERLASEPEVALHANKAGLYQSLFSFQDARDRERHWGPLEHSSVLVMQKGATEDFSLWLMEVPGGLEGGINYNVDLFDESTARLFRDRLIALLQRAAESPDVSVAELLAMPGDDAQRFAAWIQARNAAPVEPVAPPRSTLASAGSLSAAETRLAEIWARLLGIDVAQITGLDNFFDIGGNSLLVMQAVAAAQSELGLHIEPQRYVFEPLSKLAGGNDRRDELARLWAELLGIDSAQIQAGDNFFDLGGNSLLAMRAVSDAERLFGLKVDPGRYVYETLQQLSVPAADSAAAAALSAAGTLSC